MALAHFSFQPGTDSRYRRLPVIGPLLDDWLARLRSLGYTELSIRNLVVRIARLIRWLQRRRGSTINRIGWNDLHTADEFFRSQHIEVAGAARVLGQFLAERHLLRPEAEKLFTRIERQTLSLANYLREVRGLRPQTIMGHCRRIRSFLQFLKLNERPSALGHISPAQIDTYLCRTAKTNNRFSMQQIVGSLRTFLRWRHAEGLLHDPLHQRIDTPRTYRLEQLPRAWPWDQVTALLRSVDCSSPSGLRDFTLLYLAACYGLRSGELVRLTLDDIEWRASTLTIRQTKTRQTLVLPLAKEGRAVLVRYLSGGRPSSTTEMGRLLATANTLPASHRNRLRAPTARLALVLLFCCGLRRGELLRLRVRDFDRREKTLRILETKFHKSRLVPLPRSVVDEVDRCLALRRSPLGPDAPLLCNRLTSGHEAAYCPHVLTDNWQLLCLTAGVVDERGRPPRLHDLRHSFAVTALDRWYRQGIDVSSKLPHLATYLGHVSIASTHYYLRLSPKLGQSASHRFHQYASRLLTPKGIS